MEQISRFSRPSWAGLILAAAILAGACLAALVIDDSLKAQADAAGHTRN